MKIKAKLSIIIIVVLILLTTVSYFLRIFTQSQIFEREITETVSDTKKEYNILVEKDVHLLSSTLDVFLSRKDFRSVFLEKDREKLYQISFPLFQELKNQHEITHFYYHSLDGFNFLRVHNKDVFGDKITRFTFKQAEDSKKMGAGIELGKTAFALRVVKPFYDNGELVGYVEFGQEINSFLEELKSGTGNEFAMVVEKKFLNKEDWDSSIKIAGLGNNWNDFDDYLIIDTTIERKSSVGEIATECFDGKNIQEKEGVLRQYKLSNGNFLCGGFSLHDASGRNVGSVLMVSNLSSLVTIVNRFNAIFLVVSFLSIIIIFLFYYLIVSKTVTKPIENLRAGAAIIEKGDLGHKVGTKSEDEIGVLSRAFDKMTFSIKEARADVDRKVEEQTEQIAQQRDSLEERQKAILNILEDVEAEKEKTAEEKKKIDTILHSIGDGVFVVDEDYKIIVYNKISAKLSGFSEEEALGKRYDEVLNFVFEKTREKNEKFIKRAFETGEVSEMSNHTVLIKKDKTEIPVDDSAAPIKDADGKVIGCVVVFRDVTKEREIDRAKTEFISVASHQLRTPLTAIQWVVERFLKTEKLTGEKKEYLEDIHTSTRKLNELVDLLLNVSRIEGGSVSVSPKELDLVDYVKSYISETKPLRVKKNIEINFDERPETLKIVTDGTVLRNIVQSVISNAIEYTPEGGKIGVSLKTENNHFLLKVSDTGIGIPEKEQARIFEKFSRGTNAQLVKTDGTGLGLYVAKEAVDLLGGKIWLESPVKGREKEENPGTTFCVELPVKVNPKEGEKRLA